LKSLLVILLFLLFSCNKISKTRPPVKIKTLSGHTDSVTSIVFSTDGDIIVSGSSDDTIKLWDAGLKQ